MPKTKIENLIFTLIMAFGMVYCMTVYSIAIHSGDLQGFMFIAGFKEMFLEYIIVVFVVFFVTTKTATKLAFRFVSPGKDLPILVTLSVQTVMVCQMVPLMTLVAAILHPVADKSILTQWIQSAVWSFPFALCIQLFFIGPLVRMIFGKIKSIVKR